MYLEGWVIITVFGADAWGHGSELSDIILVYFSLKTFSDGLLLYIKLLFVMSTELVQFTTPELFCSICSQSLWKHIQGKNCFLMVFISLVYVFTFPMMKRLCVRLIAGGNKPI